MPGRKKHGKSRKKLHQALNIEPLVVSRPGLATADPARIQQYADYVSRVDLEEAEARTVLEQAQAEISISYRLGQSLNALVEATADTADSSSTGAFLADPVSLIPGSPGWVSYSYASTPPPNATMRMWSLGESANSESSAPRPASKSVSIPVIEESGGRKVRI